MENTVKEGKTIAITSYILIVGVLIAISMNSDNKNSFASFHIRQACGLSVLFISLGLIISNFQNIYILFSMWIFISILWTYAIFTAALGQTKPIPLVGTLFQKFFKTIS